MKTRDLLLLICGGVFLVLTSCANGGGEKDVPVVDPPIEEMIVTDRPDLLPDVTELVPDPDVTPEPTVDAEVRPDPTETTDPHPEDGACTVGLTGDPCASATQCACVPSSARQCVTSLGGYITFRGGYCSATCTAPADCGAGANCADIYSGTKVCLKTCSSASQCRMAEQYQCTTIPSSSDTRTYCLPPMGTTEGG